jgi:WD40 repeat protein
MLNESRQRFGPTTRFLLGMAGILALLLIVAGLWLLLPVRPRLNLHGPAPCHQVIVSGDGGTLATIHPQTLILWDMPSGKQRKTLRSDSIATNVVPGLFLSQDGESIFFAGEGERQVPPSKYCVKLWRPTTGADPKLLRGAEYIGILAGRNLITRGQEAFIIWDSVTGEKRKSIPTDNPWGLVAADEELLVIQADSQAILILDASTIQERFRLPPTEKDVITILNNTTKLLAAVRRSQRGIVEVWDLKTGQKRGTLWTDSDFPLEFSPDGSTLVTAWSGPPGKSSHSFVFWDLSEAPFRQLGAIEKEMGPEGQLYSPDGRWFCNTGQRDDVWLYSASTLQRQAQLIGADWKHQTFAPDSKTVVSLSTFEESWIHRWLGFGNDDSALLLWDVPRGRMLASFSCSGFSYFPDGKSLVTWGKDDAIEIWDIPPHRPWWIEYGLPVVFAVSVLLGVRLVWRWLQRRGESMPEAGASLAV